MRNEANSQSSTIDDIMQKSRQPRQPEPQYDPRGGERGTQPETTAETILTTQTEGEAQPRQPQATGENTNETSRFDDNENVDPQGSDVMRDITERSGQGGRSRAENLGRNVGMAAGAFQSVTVGIGAANAALNGLSNAALKANAGLAMYNATIAEAVAQAEADQINRQINQGEIMGPQYRRLSESQNEYRDMMNEIQSPLQGAALDVAASFSELRNNLLSFVFPYLKPMAAGIEDIAAWVTGREKDEAADSPLGALGFLSDVSDGKFDGNGTTYFNVGNRPLMSDADRRRIFGP